MIALTKNYLAEEEARLAGEQNLFTPTIKELFQQVLECERKIAEGEARRALAADTIADLDQQAKELIATMINTIAAAYPGRSSKAKEWGFETKKTTKNILTPKSQKARLDVIASYIDREQSRPETERFTIPALADVVGVYQNFIATLKIRDAGQNQRETSVNASNTLVKELAQYLQLASGVIIGKEYKLKITPALQNWGFKVVERRRNGSKTGSNEEALAPSSTNGQVSNSVSTDMVLDVFDQTD